MQTKTIRFEKGVQYSAATIEYWMYQIDNRMNAFSFDINFNGIEYYEAKYSFTVTITVSEDEENAFL